MKEAVVLDTNVAVVANGGDWTEWSPACVLACVTELDNSRRERVVLIDNARFILTEYRRRLRLAGQPGAGDAFFKWLWDNQANPEHCRVVEVTPKNQAGSDFDEFPSDPDLRAFDPSDRKFVAVALTSGLNPAILNATDTDWWTFRDKLVRNGVTIRFICPNLMGCG